MNAPAAFPTAMKLQLMLLVLLCAGGPTGRAQTTNAPARASFSEFQIISDRNIFNPNRYARSGPRTYTPRPTRRTTSFTLTGIMSYGEGETPGTYAFFDGSSADFRQALQRDGTIAIFKVSRVTLDAVTLQSDTNQYVLKIGYQLREESPGHWVVVEQPTLLARSSFDEPVSGTSDRRRSFDSSTAPADGSGTNNLEAAMAQDAPPDSGEAPTEETGNPPEPDATATLALPAGPAGDALQRLMEQRRREEEQTGNRN
jgi:hypothetical protein